MASREQRHASGSRWRRWLGRLPELFVILLVVAAFGNAQWDLGHRWFGWDAADPAADPAAVQAPAGLDLAAGAPAPAVGTAVTPGKADPSRVRAALAPLLQDPRLGKHVVVKVADLASGASLFERGEGAVTPASTTKLLTSVAALRVLGPMATFATRVVGSGPAITLVGGGDPFLMSSPAAARGSYPARADVTTLARRTATALRARGTTAVTVSYDTSLFSGPGVNPHWPATYLPENVVAPIGPLWVDEALDAAGRYVADPPRVAAQTFVAALRAQGITVTGPVAPRVAPAGAATVATVRSAPVGEIVQQTLAVSDNLAAEVLARHVGASVSGDASFTGATAAVFAVLRGLGVDLTGSTLYDGSGLSRENELTATTLLDVVRVAAASKNPGLREAITGLPVAGFSGSLVRRFDDGPAAARGRVLAKTGTLTGVHGLAGIAADLDGDLMAFVLVVDRVGEFDNGAAAHQLDLMAAALGSCRCGG